MANLQEALPAVHGMGKKQEAAFVEKYLTLADSRSLCNNSGCGHSDPVHLSNTCMKNLHRINVIAASEEPFFHIKTKYSSPDDATADDALADDALADDDPADDDPTDEGTHLYIDTLNLQMLYDPLIESPSNLALVIKLRQVKDSKFKFHLISNAVIPEIFYGFTGGNASPYYLAFQKTMQVQLFQLEPDPDSDTTFAIWTDRPDNTKTIYLTTTVVPVYDQKGKKVGGTKTIIVTKNQLMVDNN